MVLGKITPGTSDPAKTSLRGNSFYGFLIALDFNMHHSPMPPGKTFINIPQPSTN